MSLEVGGELGRLRRAHAGEVPQPPIGRVPIALDPGDNIPEAEQHLAGRQGHALPAGRR